MASETLEGKIALEGRVALLLNEREIVINIGAEQGVTEGELFGVYLPKPIEVRNPETGELLGEIDDLILKVEAQRVNPKFTICETVGHKTIGSMYGLALNPYITAIPIQDVPLTLRTADSTKPKPIDEKDSIVKIGYRVRSL
jgi:hypothetical protein